MTKPNSVEEQRKRYLEIVTQLTHHVVGQRRAIQWLAMAATEHECGSSQIEGRSKCVLLVGPTGTGKTELVRSLAKILQVPFCRIDASSFAPTSFKGTQLDVIVEILEEDLLQRGPTKSEETNRGVVMIDEIDKIAFMPEKRRSDVQDRHFEQVQNMFLPLFEGKPITANQTTFNSSEFMLIAAGAFLQDEFRNGIKERLGLKPSELEEFHEHITHEDLVRFGFLPELVGRIRAIAVLKQLGEADVAEILQRWIAADDYVVMGCRLVFDDGVVEHLARAITKMGLGARGTGILMERIKLDIYSQARGIIDEKEVNIFRVTTEYAFDAFKTD
jgi:ATP-dependent Clp protease ATP-binding subunit ClpX